MGGKGEFSLPDCKNRRPGASLYADGTHVAQQNDAGEVMQGSAGGVQDDWPTLLDGHVRQHGRFYHRLAYGVLQSTEAAADICRRAFLRAWEHRDRIRDPRAMKSWLARVVMNESFCVLRRRRTERQVLEDRAHWALDDDQGAAETAERRRPRAVGPGPFARAPPRGRHPADDAGECRATR